MLSFKMWSVPHVCKFINKGKLVIQLETEVGSELPLTLFDVTHPGLDAVRVDVF